MSTNLAIPKFGNEETLKVRYDVRVMHATEKTFTTDLSLRIMYITREQSRRETGKGRPVQKVKRGGRYTYFVLVNINI